MDLVLSGATGFVGSAVLRASGRNRIHALIRDKDRLPSACGPASLRAVEGDIRRVPKELFPSQPHIVIHLATRQIDSDGTGFDEINVEGTRRLVASWNDATQGILYGSSASVYGQQSQIDLDESAPTCPETALAHTRAQAEQIILGAAAARGIGAYCLRPRFIFGRGDRHTFPGLVRLIRRGIQPGSGAQEYSIIDVDDYARVLLSLAEQIYTRSVTEQAALNLAYTRPVRMNDIVSVICSEFGLARPWIRIPVRRWMTRSLRCIPTSAADSLATRLELFGLSHTFRVDKLCARIGSGIPATDPLAVLRSAASHHQPVSHDAIEAGTRC